MEAQTEIVDDEVEAPIAPDDVYVSAKKVRQRYGDISDMGLWRWLHDPEMNFPQPEYFGRRRYWKLSWLERWERERAARRIPA